MRLSPKYCIPSSWAGNPERYMCVAHCQTLINHAMIRLHLSLSDIQGRQLERVSSPLVTGGGVVIFKNGRGASC